MAFSPQIVRTMGKYIHQLPNWPVLKRVKFWEKHAESSFNERQVLLMNKLLNGFEGKLTSSKWAKIARSSQDTALRDIQNLIDRKIFIKKAFGGRSTS